MGRLAPLFHRPRRNRSLSGFWLATVAQADDQQLLEDYLGTHGGSSAVARPITDDYVGRTFPSFRFFGVIFRQYPAAVRAAESSDRIVAAASLIMRAN